MSSTGTRMLELLTLLQARRHWTGSDLAGRLGVSDRTLRRDVERLRDLGYPVEASRGVAGGYQLGQGGRLPPLLLNNDEAVAAAIALRNTAGQPIGGIADDAVSALVKIAQLLPPRRRSEVEAIAEAVSSPPGEVQDVALDTLMTIARSSRDSDRLRFTYLTHSGVSGDRHVEPHHVVPLGHRWYLVAWDLDRSDWRTFRIDRITGAWSTGRRFERRAIPSTDPATFVTQSIASIPNLYHVAVVVEAPLDAVQDVVGAWGTAESESPGITRIEMHVDALSWPVMFLAAINAKILSAEPSELRTLLRQLADSFDAIG